MSSVAQTAEAQTADSDYRMVEGVKRPLLARSGPCTLPG